MSLQLRTEGNERDLFEPKCLDVIAQGVRTRSSSNSVFAAVRDRSRGRSRCFLNGTTSRTRSSSNSVFAAARDRAEEAAAAQIAAAALAQEQKNEAALAERLERRVEEIVAARRAAIHEARCRVEEIIAARRAASHEAHRRVEEIVAARRAAIDDIPLDADPYWSRSLVECLVLSLWKNQRKMVS